MADGGGFDEYPVTPPLPPSHSHQPPPFEPPPRPSRSRRRLLIFLGGVLLIFLVFVGFLVLLSSSFQSDGDVSFDFGGDKVALVEVTGVIQDSRQTIDLLRRYWKDSSVRAIVLRIDSPGGGVAASQEIHEEVKRIRDSKDKPIVVSMGGVAASGGYYIACPANRIVANAGTITGSIGVISSWTNYEDLLSWAKMKDVTIKSGAFKDSGSPTREMTVEERQYFQGLVDELCEQFVGSVADGRKLPVDKVRSLADGRVYSGAQAKKLGLIDELGNLQDAISLAGKLGGIRGEPRIVEPKKERVTLWDLIFGNIARFFPTTRAGGAPVFEYRWAQGKAPELLERWQP